MYANVYALKGDKQKSRVHLDGYNDSDLTEHDRQQYQKMVDDTKYLLSAETLKF